MIGNTCPEGWRHPKRLVLEDEVVREEVQSNRVLLHGVALSRIVNKIISKLSTALDRIGPEGLNTYIVH
jgi:hypothetical protein